MNNNLKITRNIHLAAPLYKTLSVSGSRPQFNQLSDRLKAMGASHVITEEALRLPQMQELFKVSDC